jgi:dipeptidyl aminopeptidase/acylaminoacyl peptidase
MKKTLNTWGAFATIFHLSLGFSANVHSKPPPLYPVEAFAKMPLISQPQLSPDGKSVAYIRTAIDNRKTVIAHPIAGGTPGPDSTIVLPAIKKADVSWFKWANNDTVLVAYSSYRHNNFYKGKKVEQTRLVSASYGKSAFNLVKPSHAQRRVFVGRMSFAAIQSNIINMLVNDPKHILLAIDDDMDGTSDIRKINVYTGEYSTVQGGAPTIASWLTDTNGTPILGYNSYAGETALFIHETKRDIWSASAITNLLDADYIPIDIHPDGNSAIFYAVNQYDRKAIGRFSLLTGNLIEWVFSNDKYDAQGVFRSDMTGHVIGAYFYDTALKQVFMPGREHQVLSALNKAMPKTNNILRTSDKTGNLWLASLEGPHTVPRVVSLNVATGEMGELAKLYPDIRDEHVSPTQKYNVTMRDDLVIEAYVTMPLGREAKNLPTVILPHGGPWSRDDESFDPEAQMLANRGYLVIKPNFRGSDGYGVKFEQMGKRQWGGTMQDDVTDTARWAIETGLADPARLCIVGGSYGGYAALLGAVKTPDLFACAVSVNGVVDLPLLWTDDAKFIWYRQMRDSIGENRSDLKKISPYHRAEEIKIPVMLVAAKDDNRVNYKHSKRMYKKLNKLKKPVQYIELKSGGHSIDVDEERARYFTALESFLAEHLSSPATKSR